MASGSILIGKASNEVSPDSIRGKNPPRGGATAFSNEKYNIRQYQYPDDLYTNQGEYGGNYVVFYINVAEDSRILKTASERTVDSKDVPSRLRGDAVDQQATGATTVIGGAITTALPGAAAGAVAGAKGGIRGVTKGALKGGALGAIPGALGAGAVVDATKDENGKARMARQQKRLEKAIALHVPNQLNIRYGMNYDVADTLKGQLAESGVADSMLKAGGTAAVVAALTKGPNAELLSAQSGLASNPKKENLFKSVDFRTFTFEYQFFPRSAQEAEYVQNIIYEFKYHMHPEYKDDNNFLFIYPSEFDIFYYNNGQENLHLHRHTSCVLTEMNVNYTPNALFNTFAGGMPTQINIQMTFKELAILTKDQIQDRF